MTTDGSPLFDYFPLDGSFTIDDPSSGKRFHGRFFGFLRDMADELHDRYRAAGEADAGFQRRLNDSCSGLLTIIRQAEEAPSELVELTRIEYGEPLETEDDDTPELDRVFFDDVPSVDDP